ncbi:DUF1801 domain-containing protein [Chitinophagaceae bacterium LB-8]|uniref:DUF1801 domain-containing protein n=1 Tax=Paraflavisolibacter caeni TaxID=2982496 RepID=A0A9X3BHC8_9BACT|nr:DUF1801 domain-containing protein [Paraflavisolibacter caeni]MCU7549367.1 DUF1801 domain-containing protein [Paraflavisolibacter caeni]
MERMDRVDEYIKSFPPNVQQALSQIRATIKKKAPQAIESISYGMPVYKTNGKPLVYFAGFKQHIGFYATPTGHEAFAGELSKYKQGKGSVQFPLDQPMPLELIERIVAFRVEENEKERMAKEGSFPGLSAPAKRALENNGITTLEQLSRLTEKEVLSFHGMGKSSIPKLNALLKQAGLAFNK